MIPITAHVCVHNILIIAAREDATSVPRFSLKSAHANSEFKLNPPAPSRRSSLGVRADFCRLIKSAD